MTLALSEALGGTGPELDTGRDAMAVRILDAAMDQLLAHGLRHFSVDEVARRAKVNRITIYRRFAGKDELLRGVILREGRRLFTAVDTAISGLASPHDQIVEGFAAAVTLVRGHPLVARLRAHEPDTLGALFVVHGPMVLALARQYLVGHVVQAQQSGHLATVDAEVVAELAVRLSLTLVMLPESRIPLDSADDARRFARQYLAPALGRKGTA